ncbi:MAG: UDP-glucose 6-dehydrogenase [Acidobacteria bacterium]|jgi:UDPglucose 6-dehydrogenase|nr:UDP-glucose 6-dehydrogenase [Acidobacteriota bacterium]MDP7479221.1 UDP-glucose/GDP-mannose dehydrogenase family protein [Vicinamibacterales bacterium]HJN44833.1 UDP-glucose/GDP-mannose dehydrogenase family protein [Vicinamibacterales bacterium]|tara:strand:- start:1973 stop:3268 length:1296 start_codon:yes stop_codon:yes gene_type:complete
MKITVVGTGYVGLVVGACLAETGNDVVCVDIDERKIRGLRRGRVPIYEPGLEELVRRNQDEKRLVFSTALARSARGAEVIFIAVGTPPDEDGSADMQYVLAAVRAVARAMTGYLVVAIKSTVPVGTADRVREEMGRETTHPFSVVSNPEFLKQGSAVDDFLKPDRVVVGADDQRARELMRGLYAPFTRTGAPVVMMDCASAELSKYAANAMLATRVSFMNEIANVCERFGANVDDVRRVVASDRRIGPSFLFPGIGYGGSCFPKDVKALMRSAREAGYEFRILEAVEAVNHSQKRRLFEKMQEVLGSLDGKRIAIWGLSFKPRTDDMREAPAITMIEALEEAGAKVVAYDPQAQQAARTIFDKRIRFAAHSYDALKGADALGILTEWNEFREPDFRRMRALMRAPVIFDGRNLFDLAQMRALGFSYHSIGR